MLETSGLELQRSVAIKPEWKTINLRAVAFVQEANGEISQAVATPGLLGITRSIKPLVSSHWF